MSRKGKSITLSVLEQDKIQLEHLAREFGMIWGDRPNISKLVEAIARKHLRIAPNHDWPQQRINALAQARKALIDAGQIDNAIAISNLLLERSEITIPLRHELEQFIAKPALPWRLEIERYILQEQPFQLTYQDAAERLWQFHIRYAEIEPHNDRLYLDCWCEETEGNQDLPELSHNWCLRLDRIADAAISPIPGIWRSSLDTISVELHLYRGLAFAYESKTNQDEFNDWHPERSQTRQVIRQVSNTFWLIREVLRYGRDCEVIAPENVRLKVRREIEELFWQYNPDQ
jgi:hypothetical protein